MLRFDDVVEAEAERYLLDAVTPADAWRACAERVHARLLSLQADERLTRAEYQAYRRAAGSCDEQHRRYFTRLLADVRESMLERAAKRTRRNTMNARGMLGTGLTKIMETSDIEENILRLLTLQQGRRLGGACKKLTQRVRLAQDTTWLPNALVQFHYDPSSSPTEAQIYHLFRLAYGFFAEDSLPARHRWLIRERLYNYHSSPEETWQTFFACVPTLRDEETIDDGVVYITKPDTPSQVLVKNMEDLLKALDSACYDVFESCWTEWKTPNQWCDGVLNAFVKWQEKCSYQIDATSICNISILSKVDERAFWHIENMMDAKLRENNYFNDRLRPWETFALTLLRLCYPSRRRRDEDDEPTHRNYARFHFKRSVSILNETPAQYREYESDSKFADAGSSESESEDGSEFEED